MLLKILVIQSKTLSSTKIYKEIHVNATEIDGKSDGEADIDEQGIEQENSIVNTNLNETSEFSAPTTSVGEENISDINES